ncbi:MAG: hypothetical protein LBE31_08805, partial [Deltaproteobacteria bacterium]|nr:hypothetical protein [Deltaproteobacteria bacterium]
AGKDSEKADGGELTLAYVVTDYDEPESGDSEEATALESADKDEEKVDGGELTLAYVVTDYDEPESGDDEETLALAAAGKDSEKADGSELTLVDVVTDQDLDQIKSPLAKSYQRGGEPFLTDDADISHNSLKISESLTARDFSGDQQTDIIEDDSEFDESFDNELEANVLSQASYNLDEPQGEEPLELLDRIEEEPGSFKGLSNIQENARSQNDLSVNGAESFSRSLEIEEPHKSIESQDNQAPEAPYESYEPDEDEIDFTPVEFKLATLEYRVYQKLNSRINRASSSPFDNISAFRRSKLPGL